MNIISQPIIKCDHLSVGYGREAVLKNVSLDIDNGMILMFAGPNGAGKTTLLRTILGLLKPLKGRLVTPFNQSPPGYVPQQTTIDPLYPISARQIVAMGFYPKLGIWRRLTRHQNELLNHTLYRFGLENHAHKTYGALSGGMKQKVLIARALVSGADVFIMDEPVSQLDETSENEVLERLYDLSRQEGKTVLIALHGWNDLISQVDKLCWVDQGRVHLTNADAHRLKQRPSNSGI